MALSALIGRRMISLLFFKLMIMTSGLESSLSFWRTHMKLSDSRVYDLLAPLKILVEGELTQELNPMEVGYYMNQCFSP